jgi:hypothetical protein
MNHSALGISKQAMDFMKGHFPLSANVCHVVAEVTLKEIKTQLANEGFSEGFRDALTIETDTDGTLFIECDYESEMREAYDIAHKKVDEINAMLRK